MYWLLQCRGTVMLSTGVEIINQSINQSEASTTVTPWIYIVLRLDKYNYIHCKWSKSQYLHMHLLLVACYISSLRDLLLCPVILHLLQVCMCLEILATVCGIECANAEYSCIWCKCPKKKQSDTELEWSISDHKKELEL